MTRILVVDDDPEMLDLVSASLRGEGYEARCDFSKAPLRNSGAGA